MYTVGSTDHLISGRVLKHLETLTSTVQYLSDRYLQDTVVYRLM